MRPQHLQFLGFKNHMMPFSGEKRQNTSVVALHVTASLTKGPGDCFFIKRQRLEQGSASKETDSRRRACRRSRPRRGWGGLRKGQRRFDHLCVVRRGGGLLVGFKPAEESALGLRSRRQHDGCILNGNHRMFVLQPLAGKPRSESDRLPSGARNPAMEL